MHFRELVLLTMTFMALGSWAAAGDEQSAAAPQPTLTHSQDTLTPDLSSQPSPPAFTPGASDRFQTAGTSSSTIFRFKKPQSPDPGMYVRSLAEMNGSVCYTMRSYKVKPSERLPENDSGFRGYSTCQMASTYNLRSADTPGEAGAKRK